MNIMATEIPYDDWKKYQPRNINLGTIDTVRIFAELTTYLWYSVFI